MSVSLMSATFKAKFPDVDVDGRNVAQSTMKIVLLAMADHANDEGRSIYPSVGRLSRMTGLTDRSVQRAIDALEILGIIEASGWSEHHTKEYRIMPATLNQFQGGEPGSPKGESSTKRGELGSPKPLIKPSINQRDIDAIGAKIAECKIILNPNSAFIVNSWKEWFSDDVICRALELGTGKSINYTDRILCNWHKEGVPPERTANAKSTAQNHSGASRQPVPEPIYTDEDREVAAEIVRRQAARTAAASVGA